jgi:beta-lactamase regulating signal transducer with metallopeptidase domain
MDRFNALFDSQFIYALGWTIVHSFWQSLLVFALLGACLLISKRSKPETRYWLSMAALLCCLLISIKTFIYCYQDVALANSLFAQLQTTLAAAQNQNWWAFTFQTINPWLDTIVMLWCAGFVFQGLRYALDITLTQKLKHQSVSALPEYWDIRLTGLAKELGITKQVSFLNSTKVKIPSVVGHFKPVVLLPLGILTQLPQAQLEAIVLHELAHIKRHDYLINILQSLVKVLFFFNPFVLAISKKIDIERENICDDLAVKTCGDPLIFASSLSQFADVTPVSQSAMAAGKDKYLLLARVKRLFSNQGKLSVATERLIALLGAGFLGLALNVNASNQPAQPVFDANLLEPTTNITEVEPSSPEVELEHSLPEITEPEMAETPVIAEPIELVRILEDTPEITTESAANVEMDEPKEVTQSINESVPELKETPLTLPITESMNSVPAVPSANLLAQSTTDNSDSAALSYVASENQTKQHQKNSQHISLPDERVYAITPKFNTFSLESAAKLEGIEQLIFTPISTSETQFSSRQKNGKRIVSQYFSELQNKQPRIITLNKSANTNASMPNLSHSLLAQIRIKDVKMYNTNVKFFDDSPWKIRSKRRTTADQRKTENRQKDQNRYKSSPDTDSVSNNTSSQKYRTQDILVWDVTVEIVLANAETYEYAGYATRQIRLDSRTLEPSVINQARQTGSRTKAERNADMIKNAWDVLIEGIQNDVYLVTNAIKNKELQLTTIVPNTNEESVAQSIPDGSSSVALNFAVSENNNTKTKNKTIERTLPKSRVYVSTDKFKLVSLESSQALDDVEQIIFAPISTSHTEFLRTSRKSKKMASQYFSEAQNQQPKAMLLNNLNSKSPTKADLESSLVAQIRIKQVKILNTDSKSIWNPHINTDSRRASNGGQILRTKQQSVNRFKASPGPDPTTSIAYGDKEPTISRLSRFILEASVEVILVKATTYEYVGYGTKKVFLDTRNVEQSLLDVARNTEDLSVLPTKQKRNTNRMKNAWDIMLSHLQKDIYQVASAIKNKELEFSVSDIDADIQMANEADFLNKQSTTETMIARTTH